MEETIMVSVIMASYNHKKYVCQAVDSVLSQRTNFKYEVLIGDDASTDGTGDILISKYRKNDKIRLLLRSKNVGGTKNAHTLYKYAKGKYLCICECDDYWTDKNYLQTAVDWMETHEGYAAVATRRIVKSERTNRKTLFTSLEECNCDISLDDFMRNRKNIDISACLFVNFFHDGKSDYRIYRMTRHMGDLAMAIYILQHGNIFQLDNIVGVYRTDREKGSSNYNSITNSTQIFLDHMKIIKYMKKFCYPELDYLYLVKRYASGFLRGAEPGTEKLKALLIVIRQMICFRFN